MIGVALIVKECMHPTRQIDQVCAQIAFAATDERVYSTPFIGLEGRISPLKSLISGASS